MSEIIIRQVKFEDAGGIAQLSGELGYPTSIEEIKQRIEQMVESAENVIFAAITPDDTVIGWIHVFSAMRLTSKPFAEIGGIVVAEDYRRQGIGKSLLANAEKWAIKKDLTKLRVRSRASRNDAHSFFIDLGSELSKNQEVFDKILETSSSIKNDT